MNYVWDDGYSGSFRDSLPVGTYSINIFDDFGSDTTIVVTLTQPDSLQANLTKTDIKCFNQRSGKASVSPSGGLPPYQILWNDLGTTPTKSNLQAGEYWVTITDANGCKVTDTTEIIEPDPIYIFATKQDPLCFGASSGAIRTNVQGGFEPYNFTWSSYPNNFSDSLVNIPSGSYQLTVSDAGGCKKDTLIALTNPTVFRVESSATGIGCYESGTGTASISLSGGGGTAYAVVWTADGSSGLEKTDLNYGYHYFEATDGFCVKYDSVFVDSIPSPVFAVTTTPANCDLSDGKARVNGTGGTGFYFYNWQVTPTQNTQQATGLSIGDYTVIVTDNVCTDTLDFTIANVGAPSFDLELTEATCELDNGVAIISNVVSTGNYTVDWGMPTFQNLDTAIGIAAGNYSVTLTDEACSVTQTFEIKEILTFFITDTIFILPNCGASNGEILLNVTQGNTPISFLWSNGAMSNSSGSVIAGNYTVIISDTYCSQELHLPLSNAGGPDITMTPTAATCSDANGEIVATHNGTGTYTISWSHDPGLNQLTATNLAAGNYSIVLNENNCVYTQSVEVENLSEPSVREFITHAKCEDANGQIVIVANGGTGVYSYVWDGFSETGNILNTIGAGTYTVHVNDGNCTVSHTYTVNNIPSFTLATTTVDASCENNNGEATVTATGGSGTYTYLWKTNSPETTASVNQLAPGTYVVVVKDGNCTDSAEVTIVAIPSPTLSYVTNPSFCEGGNGSIEVTISDGINPILSWADGFVGTTRTGLDSGSYVWTLTDDNCSSSGLINVTYTPIPSVPQPTISPATCGADNGSATIPPVSGYTFRWVTASFASVGSGTSIADLASGNYGVIMESSACSDTAYFSVGNAPEFTLSTDFIAASCDLNNGVAEVIVNGGVGDVHYTWADFPLKDSTAIVGLDAGSYLVTVSDLYCSQQITVDVPRDDAPTLTEVRRRNSYCGADNGFVVFEPQGGSGFYSYTWDPVLPVYGDSTALIGPGTYELVFSDGNCSQTLTYTNPNQPLPYVDVVPTSPDACNRGIGKAYVVDALPNGFSYTWSSGRIVGDTATLLAAGDHFITISGFGCDTIIPFTIQNLPQNDMRISVTPDTCEKSVGTISLEPINSAGMAAFSIQGLDFGYQTEFTDLPHGNYTVSMVDELQCYVTYDTVIAHYIPTSNTKEITTNPNYPIVDQEFDIHGKHDFSWSILRWEIDGEDEGNQNPISHIYQENNELIGIRMILVNEQNCLDSATLYRDIDPGVSVYIPNSFTPDNDGYNDTFFPVLRGIATVDGGIYTRWGELIFEFTDLESIWDGTFERVAVKSDVYNYRFRFRTTAGKEIVEVGHVVLLR